MNYLELKGRFDALGNGYKTADVDRLNRQLIREGVDVSFLKDIILSEQRYHRTYFCVSLAGLKTLEEKLRFIEDNFYNLEDWWHVDQLQVFLKGHLRFDYTYEKAKEYVLHPHPFARRVGYVLFMPTLVKGDHFEEIIKLFHDDDHYYVVMAEAWLISYLGMYHTEKTYEWLKTKPLKYNIVGKGIQKICDSYRISFEDKERFKALRELYR